MESLAQPALQQTTKRQVLAQIFICSGCCCGHTERGKPPVPIEWLKDQWKKRKLKPHVQLTISGCLGPCDLVNVVAIMTANEQIWLGGIQEDSTYEAIMDWASSSVTLGYLPPLPVKLHEHIFERFEPVRSAEHV
ncbi:(2Fe-2S) ferredoxin domain-containing protein [Alicyclobacillus pomorum]|uniref:(2Fe-2S) ferredoxin domain-containing protein n=1 Tax=Alicyclobacillus pomorum TaxID=204470 RepID=UPI000412C8A9|nr:(2Fe-2S) ferredoxin domain-containing protein [Alicyclobacillus pomorum]